MNALFELHRGATPLLVSLPHAGTAIPDELAHRYVPRALEVEDTDWHLPAVYRFAGDLGASVLVPHLSRYVVDLNRPPDDAPMYPGSNNTELCPTRFFTGEPIYREGLYPDRAAVADRVRCFWQPYHDALSAELARLKATYGYALLWDGYSIRSELPWLFSGRLHDLNLGTADGRSCAPGLRAALGEVLHAQRDFTHVTDGRFKGGYITRRYGRPEDGVHAVQLEMSFATYMREERPPWPLDAQRIERALRPVLSALLEAMLAWRPGHG